MSKLAKYYIETYKTFGEVYKNAQSNLVNSRYNRLSNDDLQGFWRDVHKHFKS